MHPKTAIHFLFLPLLFILTFSSTTTLHHLLQTRGLPAGLFPDSVKSFSVDKSGLLEVELHQPCMAKFENRVYFEITIQANLSYGKLKGLVGMSQEELFLWLPVKDIIVRDPSSSLILFDIGVALKQISLSLFEDPPICDPQLGKLANEDKKKGYLSTESEMRDSRVLF